MLGKVLRVDLGKEKVYVTNETVKYYRKFLGGRGLNQYFLYRETTPQTNPLDPKNPLLLGAGTLVGTRAPGAVRLNVDSKNYFNNGVGSANAAGEFAPALKAAGFGNIIVKGRANKPVFLWVENEQVEIRDATKLWGKTTWKTVDILRKKLGRNVQVASIGPAGEKLVRGAAVIVNKARAAAKCGLGSIMGSKNLKAVAVKGTGEVEVANPEKFNKLVKKAWRKVEKSRTPKRLHELRTISAMKRKNELCSNPVKHFQNGYVEPEKLEKVSPEEFRKYEVKKLSCSSCPIGCRAYYKINEGPYTGTEGEAVEANSVADFASKLEIYYVPAVIKAHILCNQYGIDIDTAAESIAWAYECYEKGILTEKDTDGLKLVWGNHETLMELIRKIAFREGFGNVLAEGVKRAAEKVGRKSQKYAIAMKKQDLYETMRMPKGWALGAALSTRGGGHCSGSPIVEHTYEKISPETALKIYGVATATNPSTYKGKAELVAYHEKLHAVLNSLGICFFSTVWYDVDLLTPQDLADLVSAALNWDISSEELMQIGERIHNLERTYNFLHAGFTRKDDYPPERFFNEPIKSGPYKGEKLHRDKFDQMLDRNYKIHGWTLEGIPKPETLRKLGLDFAAEDLENALKNKQDEMEVVV